MHIYIYALPCSPPAGADSSLAKAPAASSCRLDGPECPRPNIKRVSLCLVGIWKGVK
jgi:hypothetical protein